MYAEMNPRGAKDPGNLKEYSPWFLQYQLTEQAQFEIPGKSRQRFLKKIPLWWIKYGKEIVKKIVKIPFVAYDFIGNVKTGCL